MLFGAFWPHGDFSAHHPPYDIFNSLRNRALLAEAKFRGHEIVFFSLSGVDLPAETVSGFIRKDGEWQWITVEFPHLIITSFSGPEGRSSKEEEFLSRVPSLTFPNYSKYEIYNVLAQKKDLERILMPYRIIESPDDVKEFLAAYKEVVLRPFAGKNEENIYLFSEQSEHVEVYFCQGKEKISKQKFDNYLASVLQSILKYCPHNICLAQQYFYCCTSIEQPFHLRVYVQKDEKNELVITSKYPLIGQRDSLLSNLYIESDNTNLDYFLQYELPHAQDKITKELTENSLQIVREVDASVYKGSLDELAVDFTLDSAGNCRLLDIDLNPDTSYFEWTRAQIYLGYACYVSCCYQLSPSKDRLTKIVEMLREKAPLLEKSPSAAQDMQLVNYFKEGVNSVESHLRCCYALSYATDFKATFQRLNSFFEEATEELQAGEAINPSLKANITSSLKNWSEHFNKVMAYF